MKWKKIKGIRINFDNVLAYFYSSYYHFNNKYGHYLVIQGQGITVSNGHENIYQNKVYIEFNSIEEVDKVINKLDEIFVVEEV